MENMKLWRSVCDLLSYNPDDGLLRWKVGGSGRNLGQIAGWKHNRGYVAIEVLGGTYLAHRVAWFISTGEFPKNQIDHINGDRSDNRLNNLREVTNAQNAQNKRCARIDNKAGALGVRLMRNKWQARITTNGKTIHLGSFDSKELASVAYVEAKRKQHEMGMI